MRGLAATVRGVRNRPEEFTGMQEYVEAFGQKMSSLDKVTQRIAREQKGLTYFTPYLPGSLYLHECGIVATNGHKSAAAVTEYLEDLKECAPTYTQWSNSEEELAEPLTSMASCLERCFIETEEQVKELNDNLIPTLHEYVLCTETLKVDQLLISVFGQIIFWLS